GYSFILGGGVAGANVYGINTSNGTPFPTLVSNGPDDADSWSGARGRWIPTSSIEQYAATLARWFGVPETSMTSVFPNIANFSQTNLGFMN
ncbi:MAG: Tat pathway signal protein, partial [Acidobacteriota bacterium]